MRTSILILLFTATVVAQDPPDSELADWQAAVTTAQEDGDMAANGRPPDRHG